MTVRRESVVLCRTGPGQLRADLERVLVLAGAERLDPARRTVIKFNGNVKRFYPGSNTSRWFLDALLGILHDRGFRDVSLIEGNLPQFTVEEMLAHTTLDRVLARHGLLGAGWDNLAIDVVAAKVLGFTVDEVPLLILARQRGLVGPRAEVIGDFGWETLPDFHVPFTRGAARRLTMWLEGLSGGGVLPRLTSRLLHEPLFRLYARAVGLYVELNYLRNRRMLRSGPWMQYELADGAQ